MTKQYAKLSQNEKDIESTSYIVKPEDTGSAATKRSCCFSTFVVFAVFVMLCGAIAIIIGIFFTPQVNTIIENYWKPGDKNITGLNETLPEINITNSSERTVVPVVEQIKLLDTTPQTSASSTTGTGLTHDPSAGIEVTHDPLQASTPLSSTNFADSEESSLENDYDDEEEEVTPPPTPSTQPTTPKHHGKKHRHTTPSSNETALAEDAAEMLDEAEEKFASWMLRLERFLEKSTGIHRPELVVPLFMVFCFFVALGMASCCCYVMVKRRESHRRRILGKIITDLQTGDSRSVLLGHDGDD